MLEKFQDWFSHLPKKRTLDVVTGLLTVPVLLTVTISNILNIQSTKGETLASTTASISATPAAINVILEEDTQTLPKVAQNEVDEVQPTPHASPMELASTASKNCKAGIPPYKIISPKAGETVAGDPVCVVFTSDDEGYCDTKWAYTVNDSSWSAYSTAPVCLYNMAPGKVKLGLKFKTDSEERDYTHEFVYEKHESSSSPSAEPAIGG